jgi:hypothetical protein
VRGLCFFRLARKGSFLSPDVVFLINGPSLQSNGRRRRWWHSTGRADGSMGPHDVSCRADAEAPTAGPAGSHILILAVAQPIGDSIRIARLIASCIGSLLAGPLVVLSVAAVLKRIFSSRVDHLLLVKHANGGDLPPVHIGACSDNG